MKTKEKAEKLQRKTKTYFISCIGEDGYPLTKAVLPAKRCTKIYELYFCTNTSSKFVEAISKNPKASVYFYSRKMLFVFKGCYLKGYMEIVTDMATKKKYWSNPYKNAYPEKSYTDPDFSVLRFTPKTGRFYCNFKLSDIDFAEA